MSTEENSNGALLVEKDMANLNVEDKKTCAVCSEPAERRCSACKLVHYCSSTCQKEHWPLHRKESCVPVKVKSRGGDYGEEYYVASRDIPRGDILFFEPTLLPLPKMKQGTFQKSFSLMCVTCAKPLSTVRKCTVCKWPVCCKEHEESPIHRENECRFLASKKLLYDKLDSKQDLRILRLIRAYSIKEKHPETWNKIKQLISPPFYYEDNFEIGNANMKDVSNLQEDIEIARLTHDEQFQKDFEKILHLCRRKGFFNIDKVTEQEQRLLGDRDKIGVFLYEKSCRYLPHSCGANLNWVIGEYPDFSIQIRAARAIKKGEMLTVSHLSQHLEQHQGSHVRRQHLRHLTNYLCPCKRCCDPTEYGSFYSAVACTTCQNQLKAERNLNSNNLNFQVTSTLESKLMPDPADLGWLLPKDPMDWGALDGIWECNRCGRTTCLASFLDRMNAVVDEINSYVNGRPGAELGLKSIIINNSGNFFHPNNWVIVSAVRNLLPALRPDPNDSSNILQHYRNLYILSKYLLRVDSIITQNGLSSDRAYFQYIAAESRLNLTHDNFERSTPQKPMKEAMFIKSKEEIEEAMGYIQDIFLYEDNIVNIAPQNRAVRPADLMRTSRNGNELVRQFNSVIPVPDKAHRG